MEWTRPEIIAATALAVSALSFAVSAFVAWRAFTAERPRLWLVLEPTEAPDCWLGNIHVQTGPRAGVAGHAVRLAAISTVSARNQSILLGPYQGVITKDGQGSTRLSDDYASQCIALKLPIYQAPNSIVQKGEHRIIPVAIYRPTLSRSERVTLVVTVRSLSARPSYQNYTIHSEIPGSSIEIMLG